MKHESLSTNHETNSKKSNVKGSRSDADLQKQVTELTADLQRVHADFVNFRRRVDEDRGAILDFAKQDVVLQLLPVLDNISRAMTHVPEDLQGNAWAGGITQIAKQAEETLRGMGVTKILSLGQPFDPHLHEAVGGDGDIVTEELQPGYKLGDKVIRHAMVKVGRK